MRQSAISAGRFLAPAARFGNGIEQRERFRMIHHQLASKFESVLPSCVRELVDKAFEEDGIVVDGHTTPETRRHVGVAHRMIDGQVRDAVLERVASRRS